MQSYFFSLVFSFRIPLCTVHAPTQAHKSQSPDWKESFMLQCSSWVVSICWYLVYVYFSGDGDYDVVQKPRDGLGTRKIKTFPVVYSVRICYVEEENVKRTGDIIPLLQIVYIYFCKTVSMKVIDTSELCHNLNIEFIIILV